VNVDLHAVRALIGTQFEGFEGVLWGVSHGSSVAEDEG